MQNTDVTGFDEEDSEMSREYEKLEIGKEVQAKIKSVTDIGVFIGFADNIDGLVHLSDLIWKDEGEAVRRYKNGDFIVVRIDHINAQGTLALASETSNDKEK